MRQKITAVKVSKENGAFLPVVDVGPCLDARDRFAIAALPGILDVVAHTREPAIIKCKNTKTYFKEVAWCAYKQADAMLAERKIKPQKEAK